MEYETDHEYGDSQEYHPRIGKFCPDEFYQESLVQNRGKSHYRQNYGNPLRIESKPIMVELARHALYGRKGDGRKKGYHEERYDRMVQMQAFRDFVHVRMNVFFRLRQESEYKEKICKHGGRSSVSNHVETEGGKETSDSRSHQKSKPKHRANHSDTPGSFFFFGNVGNVRLRDSQSSPSESCDETSKRKKKERRRKDDEDVSDEVTKTRKQKRFPSTVRIGHFTKYVSPEKHSEGIDRENVSEPFWAHMVPFYKEWERWYEYPEA